MRIHFIPVKGNEPFTIRHENRIIRILEWRRSPDGFEIMEWEELDDVLPVDPR